MLSAELYSPDVTRVLRKLTDEWLRVDSTHRCRIA
jgi:hypothetical protein